jgi:TonB family protein
MVLALSGILLAQDVPDRPSDSAAGQSQETIYKPGKDGVTAPRIVHSVSPEYSDKARVYRVQGTVVLRLVVTSSGDPVMIRVTKALGSGLDEKAVEAVRQWKFKPGTKDGKPVAVEVGAEVEFHLAR